MPVKEIEAFRAKFPQYSDLSDGELSLSLAKKYPDSYGDLPQLVARESNSKIKEVDPAPEETSFNIGQITAAGPLARGSQMAQQIKSKGSVADIPYIASKMLSGALGGVPEQVAENPIAAYPQMGADMASSLLGKEREKRSVMPGPKTEAGRNVGDELGFYASLLPAEMIGSKVYSGAKKAIPKVGEAIVERIPGGKNLKNEVGFTQKVRNSMFDLRNKLGRELDSKVTELSSKNPDKRIDLRDTMNQLKEAISNTENPGLRADVMRTIRKIKDPETVKRLVTFIDKPHYAESVNLRTAEDMKKAIQQGISTKMGDKFALKTAGDHELIDLVDEIKSAQAEYFPELSDIRKPYAEFMQNYRQVKSHFKPGRLSKGIKSKFGDAEIESMIKKVLPAEVVKEIGGVRNASNILKALGWAGKGLAGTGIIGSGVAIGRKLNGN